VSTSSFSAATLAEFEAFAIAFARTLKPGDVIALEGPLGSGKTTFVAAVARALGNVADVASPTFTFWHRYGGSPPLEHLDLYRVDDPREASELGLEEAFGAERIVFVEWPGRLPGLLPATAIRVRIGGAGEEPRELLVERDTEPSGALRA
jgi:tRNA threonylcarbamoyladenosine biosynthesis protein TsaE